MNSNDEAPEDAVDTSKAGSLGELVPASLAPAWRHVERVQSFRARHGERYVSVLEAVTAVVLTVGYLWWVYLYLLGGSGAPI